MKGQYLQRRERVLKTFAEGGYLKFRDRIFLMTIIATESIRSVVGISKTRKDCMIGETICAIPTVNGNRIDQQNMVVGDEISFDEKLIGEETILSTTTIENNGRDTL